MAQQPGRFSFFAPTPQAVDFSPIQRGAEAGAQAMIAAGQAIGGALSKAIPMAKQNYDISQFQKKMTSPDLTMDVSYSPLDSSFGPQLAEADAKFASDVAFLDQTDPNRQAQNRPVQDNYRKTAVVDYLKQQGYESDRAGQIYDLMKNPMNAKIIRPEKMMELRAEGLSLVAKGYMSSDELNALVKGNNVFSDQSEFNRYVSETSRAIMDPGTLSPRASAAIDQQNKLEIIGKQHEAELESLGKKNEAEMAQLKEQIRATTDRDTAQAKAAKDLLAEELTGKESLAKLEADLVLTRQNKDFENEQKLIEQKGKIEKDLARQKGQIERKLLQFKDDLEDAAESKTDGPNMFGKSEQEALDSLARSLTGGGTTAKDVSIASLLGRGEDVGVDAENILNEIGPLGGSRAPDLVKAARAYVDTSSGTPMVEVVVDGVEGASPEDRATVDRLLTDMLSRRFGRDALAVVAAAQSGAENGQSFLNILNLAKQGRLPMGEVLSEFAIEKAKNARGRPTATPAPAAPAAVGGGRAPLPGSEITSR